MEIAIGGSRNVDGLEIQLYDVERNFVRLKFGDTSVTLLKGQRLRDATEERIVFLTLVKICKSKGVAIFRVRQTTEVPKKELVRTKLRKSALKKRELDYSYGTDDQSVPQSLVR